LVMVIENRVSVKSRLNEQVKEKADKSILIHFIKKPHKLFLKFIMTQ
jgi:hypothetical protein